MAILATLRQSGGISAITRQLGETPFATAAAADALLPELLDDFLHFSSGLPALLDLIAEAGGGALAQAIMLHDNVDTQPGLMILSRIKRPGVASAAGQSPAAKVDPVLRARMMPMLAMLLGGYISARADSGDLNMAEIAALLGTRTTSNFPGDKQV